MAARTHTSSWRFVVSFAPLLGLVLVAGAALQGNPEILESVTALGILGAVAALGTLVASLTAYQLRAVAISTVAGAQPGQVSLRGRAQALPGGTPLVSPDGASCLWFEHSKTGRGAKSWDSVRPFLLVDKTGQCIVLPAGAQISGDSKSSADADTNERLLLEGDQIHVVGRLMPASESISAQLETALLVEQSETPRVRAAADQIWPFQRFFMHGTTRVAPPPPPQQAAPLSMPVLASPGFLQPFVISIDSKVGEGGYYKLAATINALLLCAAAGMVVLLTH